jgi:hypothetical protein
MSFLLADFVANVSRENLSSLIKIVRNKEEKYCLIQIAIKSTSEKDMHTDPNYPLI